MKETNLFRLIQSFAISHIVYVAAFHNWTASESKKLNVLIGKTYKAAVELPDNTSTEKLLELGIHNTLEEIAEAQRTSQLVRLAETTTGNRIITRIRVQIPGINKEAREQLPKEIRSHITVRPMLKNMHPDYDAERRGQGQNTHRQT